jgi:hypothetical protein
MKNTPQNRLSVLTLLLMLPLVAGPRASAHTAADAVTWQQSQSPSVTLGIRDKYATLGTYNALFVITDSKGNKIQKTISVKGDANAGINYPDDVAVFPEYWKMSGNYSWICIVNRRIVARGRFSITDSVHGEHLSTTDPF